MASIKRRESGYQVQIRRRGYPSVTKMFPSLKEAEAWSRLIESEMDRGIFQDRTEAERNTLGDILQRYMQEISPRKKSGAIEAIRIKRFLINENLCLYKASSLTGKLLSSWRDNRLKEVSGSTVNRELNLLSHAINIARKEWGIHVPNPIELIQRPRENKARQRRLSPSEELRLIEALDESSRDCVGKFKTGTRNTWIKPVMLFALETAMRRGEILSLKWCNINLANRTATLPDTKNGERRVVPLSSKAIQILNSIPRSIDGRAFPISEEALKHGFTRLCQRAGIEDLHFHDLRHEATSRLFEKELSLMEVASITGHRTLQMLQRITHLRPENLLQKLG